MEVKARMKRSAWITPMALGLEGAPHIAPVETVVTFPSREAFDKFAALHPSGAFELIVFPKGAGKAAPKGGKK